MRFASRRRYCWLLLGLFLAALPAMAVVCLSLGGSDPVSPAPFWLIWRVVLRGDGISQLCWAEARAPPATRSSAGPFTWSNPRKHSLRRILLV